MRKRWIAICTAAVLVLGLAGCGGSGASTETKSGSSKEKKNTGTKYELEQIVYDQEGVKITATAYTIDENNFHSMTFKVENGTDSIVGLDKTGVDINGFIVEEHYNTMDSESIAMSLSLAMAAMESSEVERYMEEVYHSVPAGETKEVEMDLHLSDALLACIGTVQQIDISIGTVRFTEPDNMETLGAQGMPEGELVTIRTDAYKGELELPEIEGTEFYNKDGIRMVVLGLEYDAEYGDLTADVYVENFSEKEIMCYDNNISVNDFMVNGYLSLPVLQGGTKAVGGLEVSDEVDIESLDDIESMEFSVEIRDAVSFEDIDTATYTYTP